jgi:ketosteroid isomerase-like protein
MLRKLIVVLGLAALSTLPLQAQDSATIAKAVNDLEVQWGASLSAGNWDAVATFLAPGYIFTGGDGKRQDRAAYVAGLRDSGDKFSTMTAGPYTVMVSGNTAVHFGEASYTVTAKNGKATKIHEVWTDTWMLQPNGMWACVATQSIQHTVK